MYQPTFLSGEIQRGARLSIVTQQKREQEQELGLLGGMCVRGSHPEVLLLGDQRSQQLTGVTDHSARTHARTLHKLNVGEIMGLAIND